MWSSRHRCYTFTVKRIRLDKLLVERGLFPDEETAKRAVLAHEVKVGDAFATSAAQLVAPDEKVTAKENARFVSRGGYKLQAALDAFAFSPAGLVCADVGCSTGGFTDCLLQADAAHVAAIDVGYGDLAWKLRQDERVAVFERTNIRTADPASLGAPFDLVVADLSFIGLAGLAPVFACLCKPEGSFIGLVKPQFESRHDETDSHGVVTDENVRARTVEEVRAALQDVGFHVEGVVESPLKGKRSGNVEYLVMATRESG